MQRRRFLRSLAAASAALPLAHTGLAAGLYGGAVRSGFSGARPEFTLDYAPHFGMFRHHAGDDLLDQLRFMAEMGFRSMEDNGMAGRTPEMQEAIAQEMTRLNMRMGVFVAHRIDWQQANLASGDPARREEFLDDIRAAVDVAKRVNATWMTVVPGRVDQRQEMEYQTVHVVESLKRAAEILEPHGMVMVLEPLNWWSNHPGMFLSRAPQAYMICKHVDSPACKILFDIYHQQISEGNLIPNIEKSWDEIGYFQIGDNPGRKEPTTGEINYGNVFKYIHERGYTDILGMEHGNAQPDKEGEQALIDAYVSVDP